MNPLKWAAYLRHQAAPYTHFFPKTVEPDTSSTQVAHAVAWLAARGWTPEMAVVIGPGTTHELQMLRPVVAHLSAVAAGVAEVEALTPWADVVAQGDIHDLPLQTSYFDFLYTSNVLEHAFAPYIALMECRRVMREGGSAYFVMPSFAGQFGGQGEYHLHCLDRAVWCELLRKTGFHVESETVTPYADGVSFYYHFRTVVVKPLGSHADLLASICRIHNGESA